MASIKYLVNDLKFLSALITFLLTYTNRNYETIQQFKRCLKDGDLVPQSLWD
jgi:hypothetical protein